MVFIGSMGLGFVWGWLMILVGRAGLEKRPFFTGSILVMSTLFPVLQVGLWGNLPAFIITTILSFSLHAAWRNTLKHNQTTIPPTL